MNFLMKNLYLSIANSSKFQIKKEKLETFICGTVISNLPQIPQILQYEGKSLTYELSCVNGDGPSSAKMVKFNRLQKSQL